MARRSRLGDIEIPNVTVAEFVLDKIKEYGDKTAIIEHNTNRQVTYREVIDSIHCCARGLISLGVKQGDVILMCSTNCLEYYFIFYAVSLIGAVLTTANPLMTAREVYNQIKDSKASRIICSTVALRTITNLLNAHPGIANEVFLIDGDIEGTIKSFNTVIATGRAQKDITLNLEDQHPVERVAFLPYSSGTTGTGKGVQTQNKLFIVQALQMSHPTLQHLHHDDIVVHFLPMFHAYALITNVVYCLWMGVTSVVMERFEIQTYLDLLSKYKATMSYVVPPVVVQLAKNPIVDEYNLTTLRTLMSSAAPLGEEVMLEVEKRLRITDLRQCYGMTEVGIVFMSPKEDFKHSSVGIIVPGVDVKVTTMGSGKPVNENEEGEVWVRGPNLLHSYLNKIMDDYIDAEGWFQTGDVAYYDTDGFYYITDRIKELIKYKGYQVAPAELEALLLKHPAVADAAVIGTPDLEAGQLPTAYIVRKAESTVTADDICDFIANQVAPQKKLRGGVKFIDNIPKSPSGKILRRLLREKINAKL